jgi:two-component sensor histidine kinase
VTRELIPPGRRPDEETLSAVLKGQAPRDTEMDNGSTVVIARSVPLRNEQGPTGALVLLRDVTDLRSRDRELVTKDATIREIHHRVKNNLQTVAALLRLQARRMHAPEARSALEEAVRRVGSIALVHETLSQSLDDWVDFDEIADRLRVMVADVGSGVTELTSTRTGSFGMLAGEVATPLAMVLTELLQNATEHAFAGGPGHVEVAVERAADELRIVVRDDGRGLPEGFDPEQSASLGLSIVRTLVESELGGSLWIGGAPVGTGTLVAVRLPLRPEHP